jgi:glycerophosphoryl diester phosphodiesterase
MSAHDWLIARPIAHRGLHGGAILENTIEAANAAASANYAIECDLQLTADDVVVVFHDDDLERLTTASGPLRAKSADDLRKISFRNASGRIPELSAFLACVAGRVPLVLELKSNWNGDTKLVERTVAALANYTGPYALMSFDPWLVRALRLTAPDIPRGIVAERYYDEPEWAGATRAQKFGLGNFTHIFQTKPDFVAYWVRDLPAVAPLFARYVLGMPLLTWTVRTEAERSCARRWADQMIFEGFRP